MLYKSGEIIYKAVRIKISIQRLKEKIKLEAQEEKEVVLHLTIDYLYNYLLTKGNYTLILEYNGGIFDSNQKEITHVAGIRSNEVEFSIE